jgi:hypothetical protein
VVADGIGSVGVKARTLFLASFVLIVAGCGGSSDPSSPKAKLTSCLEDGNAKVTRKYQGGNFYEVKAQMPDHVVIVVTMFPKASEGREAAEYGSIEEQPTVVNGGKATYQFIISEAAEAAGNTTWEDDETLARECAEAATA